MESPSNGRNDVVTQRIIVSCIGATVIVTGLAIAILAALGIDVPPSLPAFGGTALGALTGLVMSIYRPANGNGLSQSLPQSSNSERKSQ